MLNNKSCHSCKHGFFDTEFPDFSCILTGNTSACLLLFIWFLFFAADCPPVCCCRPTCLPDKCKEECL